MDVWVWAKCDGNCVKYAVGHYVSYRKRAALVVVKVIIFDEYYMSAVCICCVLEYDYAGRDPNE